MMSVQYAKIKIQNIAKKREWRLVYHDESKKTLNFLLRIKSTVWLIIYKKLKYGS